MNKKAPDDNDTRPYDEFMRYAKLHSVADEKTGEKHAYQYVSAEDVPKILLGTFVGQSDEKRKEVEEAWNTIRKITRPSISLSTSLTPFGNSTTRVKI